MRCMRLILLFVLIGSTIGVVDDLFDFSDRFDQWVATVEDLVAGSDANGGDCKLYQGLVNISATCSSQLSASQNTVLQNMIAQVKVALATTGLTNEQRLFKAGMFIENFRYAHANVFNVIRHHNILNWTSLHTLSYVIVVKQQKYVQNMISLTSSGSCPYFDALRAVAPATNNDTCVKIVDDLIQKTLTPIACNGSLTLFERAVAFYNEMAMSLEKCPALISLSIDLEISGFGNIAQYFSILKANERLTLPQTTLTTGIFPDVPVINHLMHRLGELITNDINAAIQLNQFMARVNQTFETMTDPKQRQDFLADYTIEWYDFDANLTESVFYDIDLGNYETFWDHIFLSAYTPLTQNGPVPPCPTTAVVTNTCSGKVTTTVTTTTTVTISDPDGTCSVCDQTCSG
uniref:Secreted protein n=1 Tax=Panagrolaimus sp. JU765 TaxID=591449 RepID=A0AC34R3K5_9BILA